MWPECHGLDSRTGWGSHAVASSSHRLLVPHMSPITVPICMGAVPYADTSRYQVCSRVRATVPRCIGVVPCGYTSRYPVCRIPGKSHLRNRSLFQSAGDKTMGNVFPCNGIRRVTIHCVSAIAAASLTPFLPTGILPVVTAASLTVVSPLHLVTSSRRISELERSGFQKRRCVAALQNCRATTFAC